MSVKDDGGPAFPQHDLSAYGMGPAMRDHIPGDEMSGRYEVEGMSLRDYFAAKALVGIIAKSPYKSGTLREMKASGDLEARAAAAYDYADAMLEARK